MLQTKPFYGIFLLSLLLAPPPAWGKVTPIDDYQQVLKSSEDDLTGQPDSLVCGDYGLLSTEPGDKVCSRRSLPNGKVCYFDCKCKPEYKYACNSGVHVGVDRCTDDFTGTRYKSCKCANGYVAGSLFTKNTALVNYPQASVSDGGGVVCYEKSKFSCKNPYNSGTSEETAKKVTYRKTRPHDWLPTDCVTVYTVLTGCQ